MCLVSVASSIRNLASIYQASSGTKGDASENAPSNMLSV